MSPPTTRGVSPTHPRGGGNDRVGDGHKGLGGLGQPVATRGVHGVCMACAWRVCRRDCVCVQVYVSCPSRHAWRVRAGGRTACMQACAACVSCIACACQRTACTQACACRYTYRACGARACRGVPCACRCAYAGVHCVRVQIQVPCARRHASRVCAGERVHRVRALRVHAGDCVCVPVCVHHMCM